MPELPDVLIYVERLDAFVAGEVLEKATVVSPFLLRTYDPPLSAAVGRTVTGVHRIGKRIVLEMAASGAPGGDARAGEDLFLVVHLMIAGRLRWRKRGTKAPRKNGLATFEFPEGVLLMTEASPKKRASLHVVAGEESLAQFDRGGVDARDIDAKAFADILTAENHTLKRALTDPTSFDGIGGAYADEILHRARLSPITWTTRLAAEEIERLHAAAVETLDLWIERTREEVGEKFPEKVTAFRKGMAVHGRYGEPCPDCETAVQRILYASRETNYCPRCQTGGKVLADRSLSRLLKKDWPRTIEELEGR